MGNHLVLYCDGASRGNPGPASIGAILYKKADDGTESPEAVAEVSRAIGKATNNHAEYTSLIEGLKQAAGMNTDGIDVRMDSELVVKQIRGEYRVKNAGLKPLFEEAKRLLNGFPEWSIAHIRRDRNSEADRLANEALDK